MGGFSVCFFEVCRSKFKEERQRGEVQQLNELVVRLDDQQKQEEEHKEWCEKELSETAKTKSHHEMLVEELKGKIEDTKGLIEDKKQSIADTADAIKTADEEYAELKDVRAKAKADFEAEHADYVDAIQALNQAIDLLADFYRSGSAMIQSDQVTGRWSSLAFSGARSVS